MEFLTLKLVHFEFPPFHQLQSRFSYPDTDSLGGFCSWVSALISCDSLFLPVCLSKFGGSDLFCDLDSLIDIRKVVDLQFVQLFLMRMGVMTSKPLICWTGKQKSLKSFKSTHPVLECYKILFYLRTITLHSFYRGLGKLKKKKNTPNLVIQLVAEVVLELRFWICPQLFTLDQVSTVIMYLLLKQKSREDWNNKHMIKQEAEVMFQKNSNSTNMVIRRRAV